MADAVAERQAAEKLDGAKERLRASAEESATSKRAARTPASYHVFRLDDAADKAAGSCWQWLTEEKPVRVESLGREKAKRELAIKAASSSLGPDELTGTFAAVKEGEWLPMPRRVEQRLEDVFG
jgi:hypothetical protein